MEGWLASWRAMREGRAGYTGARPDVVRLVDAKPTRVLDVGCGAGMTARLLRERYGEMQVVGVETDPISAKVAGRHVDTLIFGSVDDPVTFNKLEGELPFDLIICADVLEHLERPDITLQRLVRLLSIDGVVVTSLPNIRHISTFISLGILGTWPKRERGIHDATHLRFFARRDILELGKAAQLRPVAERRNLRLVESKSWTMIPAKLLDFWPLRAFFTFQYLHRWVRLE